VRSARITVQYKLPWFVSTAHLLTGMSYFAMLIYTGFRTRPAPSVVELERHDRLRAELGSARMWIRDRRRCRVSSSCCSAPWSAPRCRDGVPRHAHLHDQR